MRNILILVTILSIIQGNALVHHGMSAASWEYYVIMLCSLGMFFIGVYLGIKRPKD